MSTDVEKEKAARRRRDKVQLSCNLCRKRKQPCWNCSSRGLASSCTFPENSNVPAAPAAATKAASFQDRINHLENLVVQLLQQDNPETKAATTTTTTTSTKPQLCAKCSDPLTGDNEPHRSAAPAASTITTPIASATSSATSPPRTSHAPLDVGKLQIDNAKSAYVSSPHWSAVLSGLSELKCFWQTAEAEGADESDDFFPGDQSDNQYYKADLDDYESPTPVAATPGKRRFQLLFGGHRQQSLEEILKVMPPRDVVDRLVLLYFNNMMLPLAVIHSGSFLAHYEKFWKSPHDAPILWIAMLLAIMSIASQTEAAWARYGYGSPSSHQGLPPSSIPLAAVFPLQTPPYVDQVVACLILGEYSKGGTYAIEALLHYQFIEVTSSADVHADAWLLSGIVTRLAYRMGYHRDPSHFPSLSPFEGEVRRRLWITVHAMDTMMSAQMGLPRLIKAGSADVQLPRNLLDADFAADCADLPPERPPSDLTPTLHLIAKHRLFSVIGLITDVNMSVGPECPPPTIAREKELTALVQDTYDQLPDKCKFHTMLGCIADKAADIIHRIGASALLQKGLIAVHWRRLMASDARQEAAQLQDTLTSRDDKRHVRQSYVMCIDAALKVLGFQSIVESESRPGGSLFPQRIQASSVIKHEFLMSTVVLCRHMYRVAAGPFGSPLLEVALESDDAGVSDAAAAAAPKLPEPQTVEAALRHSHSIWRGASSVSSEARRIASILDALFSKLETATASPPLPSAPVMTSSSPFDGIDPGLALLDEFGLLHHLQDMNNCFDM